MHIWPVRMTDHLFPNVTISNIFKTRCRLHSTRYRMSGGRGKLRRSSILPTQKSKMFCSAIKAIYGPSKPSTTPLMPADGMTLLKEKKSTNDWWRANFSGLLNRSSIVDPAVLDHISQKPTTNSLDLPSTMKEVEKAIIQSSSNKARGMDRNPAKIYKAARPVTLEMFLGLLINI